MIIILFIPLGLLSLIIAYLSLRRKRRRYALVCALMGLFFLSLAALASYGSYLLLDQLPPLS